MTAATYKLGGQTFVSLGVSTLEHDIWLRAQRRAAGLYELVVEDDETPDEFYGRIVDVAMSSQNTLTMLGGLLVPEGTGPGAWTPALAEETGKQFGRITDEREKAVLRMILVSSLLDFFESGTRLRRRSRSSSTLPPARPADQWAGLTSSTAGAQSSGS